MSEHLELFYRLAEFQFEVFITSLVHATGKIFWGINILREPILKVFAALLKTFEMETDDKAIIFLEEFLKMQNIDCGYLLESPRRGGSNVYLQSML